MLDFKHPLMRRQMLERLWYWDSVRHIDRRVIKAFCDRFDCLMEYTQMMKNPPGAIRTMPDIAIKLEAIKNEIEESYRKKDSSTAPTGSAVY